MRVDAHVHIFPKALADHRDRYSTRDGTFRELYASPRAAIGSVDKLISSMDQHRIDMAIVANIGWETPELCRETNDYILETAAKHSGRLWPLCAVNPRFADEAARELERCIELGARGIGELHPDPQGYDLSDAQALGPLMEIAARHDLPVLVHSSEPVGHDYPGKGTVTPSRTYRFIQNFPQARIVLAHWGGGLPFYALMPEVRAALKHVRFDTAASPFLYESAVFERVADLVGAQSILFGTDFPLITQDRLLKQVEQASLGPAAKDLILGENAQQVYGPRSAC